MSGKKHKPEQIIAKLREAEAALAGGANVGQVCQQLGVSEQTLHRWRNQYGGMKGPEIK
ncbi:MAG: transposase, partial [Planctomycetota bacterium]|nr:transposase [Planctomycetota bacterium]